MKGCDEIAIYELEVYRHVEELLNKTYPRLTNYPKAEKFSLCQDIKNNFFQILSHISLGNAKQGSSRNFINKLLKKHNYILLVNGILKINKEEIENGRNEKAIQK